MQADTERELRHNLEQAQSGLVQEFQAHQKTKKELEIIKEQLRQAYVVIEMLNEKLAFKT